jgi:hypothetical protein
MGENQFISAAGPRKMSICAQNWSILSQGVSRGSNIDSLRRRCGAEVG